MMTRKIASGVVYKDNVHRVEGSSFDPTLTSNNSANTNAFEEKIKNLQHFSKENKKPNPLAAKQKMSLNEYAKLKNDLSARFARNTHRLNGSASTTIDNKLTSGAYTDKTEPFMTLSSE